MTGARRQDLPRFTLPAAALLAILGVAVVGYAPALDGTFLFDDAPTIANNPRVQDWSGFLSGLTLPDSLAGRPVTEMTFALDAARSGLQPRPIHETNLVLHLLATLLIFAFTRVIFRRAGAPGQATWSAAAVAGLFALHPIQTEAVAYASQRSEVLSSLLAVSTLLLLFAADGAAGAARARWLGTAALGVHLLAIGSKMIASAVPALFLLAGLWFRGAGDAPVGESGASEARSRGPWPRRAVLVAPLIALSALQAALFFQAIRASRDVGFSVPGLGSWRYLLTQARVIPLYVRLIAWPTEQNVDHDITPSAGLLDPPSTLAGGLFVLLLLGAAAWGCVWARGRGREAPSAPAIRIVSYGAVWFLTLLAPTSTLVPLADVAMEHRVYLASWGLLTGAVAVMGLVIRRLPASRRAAFGMVATLVPVLALAAGLHARSTLWGDPVSLWRDAAAKSPGRARPLVNIGDELYGRGNLEGAIESYDRALAVAPGLDQEPVLQRIASALLSRGRATDARALLDRVKAPGPETVVLRALAAIELGELGQAERYAWDLVVRAASYARSHETMGKVLEAKGDLVGARRSFRRATELSPGAETLRKLGSMELRLGDRAAACRTLARAAASADNPWIARWAAADASRAGCEGSAASVSR